MVKTGGSIFVILPLVVLLFSLLPVSISQVRKVAVSPLLHVLRVFCVLVFLQYLTHYFIRSTPAFLSALFQFLTFALAFCMLLLLLPGKQVKYLLTLFLSAFLSAMITIYALKGVTAYAAVLSIIQAALLTLMGLMALLYLIRSRQMVMMQEPSFWIAGGLLCYYGMMVFIELITGSSTQQAVQQQKEIIAMMAEGLRMLFFAMAAGIVGKRATP